MWKNEPIAVAAGLERVLPDDVGFRLIEVEVTDRNRSGQSLRFAQNDRNCIGRGLGDSLGQPMLYLLIVEQKVQLLLLPERREIRDLLWVGNVGETLERERALGVIVEASPLTEP